MKVISTLFLGLTLTTAAQAASTPGDSIKDLFNDDAVTQLLNLDELAGNYVGSCELTYIKHIGGAEVVRQYTTKEALYAGKFINSKKETVNLAISTELLRDGTSVPTELEYVLNADKDGLKFIQDFVRVGKTGVDNNLGIVDKGADFSYKYTSTINSNSLTVSALRSQDCQSGFCNPPTLASCNYGTNSAGQLVYKGCLRGNDKIIYKQLTDKIVVSHRTAAQLGTAFNNYSFVLPEISSYCVWEKR